METVKAMYQKQLIEGKIILTKITSTIETEDNPDSIKVILHRMKLNKPITVNWDGEIRVKDELWVDNNSIIA